MKIRTAAKHHPAEAIAVTIAMITAVAIAVLVAMLAEQDIAKRGSDQRGLT